MMRHKDGLRHRNTKQGPLAGARVNIAGSAELSPAQNEAILEVPKRDFLNYLRIPLIRKCEPLRRGHRRTCPSTLNPPPPAGLAPHTLQSSALSSRSGRTSSVPSAAQNSAHVTSSLSLSCHIFGLDLHLPTPCNTRKKKVLEYGVLYLWQIEPKHRIFAPP